jgi:riboflavin kinase / FMN adenylyltransferase
MIQTRWFGEHPSAGSVVTFGVFDGVHRGHQSLLAQAGEIAKSRSIPVIAMTFDPHPLAVLTGNIPPVLTSLGRRIELLQSHGADAVVVCSFTEEFSHLSPLAFMEEVLAKELMAKVVVEGTNVRFGHRAEGDIALLSSRSDLFDVVLAELHQADAETVSSTRIRKAVAEGDVQQAWHLLGRPHSVEGIVVHGDARGRELGYPTANLGFEELMSVPSDGIYAGWLSVAGERWPAAISIGTNPTFDGQTRRVEAYALDRTDLELYDQMATIEFGWPLRQTLKFDSIEALVAQMAIDCDQARMLTAPR